MTFVMPSDPAQQLVSWLAAYPDAYPGTALARRWGRSALRTAVRAGTVARLLPGVYCGAAHSRHLRVRAASVALWAPGAAITGQAALACYLDDWPHPRRVDAVVPYGRRPRPPAWVAIHQRRPVTEIGTPGGVRCVSRERAVIDAWATAEPLARAGIVYEALWRRATTWQRLGRELERTPRLPQRRALVRLLGYFADGATSPSEVIARRDVFVGPRWKELEWQPVLTVAGRRRTPDALHRAAQVVLEFDGGAYHGSTRQRLADIERDAEFAQAGFITVRFTYGDLRTRPEWCRRVASDTIRRRTGAL